MLAKPLAEIGGAARRIADGDYAARVPREGPEELASLADSFNQMAASLERQEQMRRDFIANAAHELRTPLTNLQGYLEALRDGVITADRATYESLHEEADRLVRLSRSLDALAEGDAGTSPPVAVELDLAAAVRSALDLAAPSIERAGLTLRTDVPATPAGPRRPGRARPGPREPALERRPLHAGRRLDHGPGRAAARRPPRLDRQHRRGHPARGPRSRVRAVLPGREVARPRARRRRHRARDRQAARGGQRRPGRRGVARRPDAVLVQPPGAEPTATAARSRSSRPGRRPARPTGSASAAPRGTPRRPRS